MIEQFLRSIFDLTRAYKCKIPFYRLLELLSKKAKEDLKNTDKNKASKFSHRNLALLYKK